MQRGARRDIVSLIVFSKNVNLFTCLVSCFANNLGI